MSSALREPPAAEPEPPELSLVPRPGRLPAPKLVLAGDAWARDWSQLYAKARA